MKRALRNAKALAIVAGFLHPAFAAAQSTPLVTTQPDPSADVAPYFVADTDPRWSDADWSKQDIEMLREKVKYVFVIFNENHSFDHEYGTFPGRQRHLFRWTKSALAPPTRRASRRPMSTRTRQDRHGSAVPRRAAAERDVRDSTDHSHPGLAAKLDVDNGVPQMDKFALDE